MSAIESVRAGASGRNANGTTGTAAGGTSAEQASAREQLDALLLIDEKLIVSGVQKIRDGAPVTIGAPAAPTGKS